MPRARLRTADLADLGTLVAHRRGMWLGIHPATEGLDEADSDYRRWARARLRSGRLVAFLVEEGREVVASGCLWLQEVQPRPGMALRHQPYLLSMYTDPAARGRGHATRIVRAAIAWCRDRGYPRMSLHASDAGRPIYEGLGFEATREMKLDLDAGRK